MYMYVHICSIDRLRLQQRPFGGRAAARTAHRRRSSCARHEGLSRFGFFCFSDILILNM